MMVSPLEFCSLFCCCFVLGFGGIAGYFWGRNKSNKSAKKMEMRLRREQEERFMRTLRKAEERRLEWDDEEDDAWAERPSMTRGERARRCFSVPSERQRQNRELRAEREIVHLQEQIDELTRQLKNAQQPTDEKVARLRQEIADLTILMSDAKSPQNAELAYLRRQIDELTRQLQSREYESGSDRHDENV